MSSVTDAAALVTDAAAPPVYARALMNYTQRNSSTGAETVACEVAVHDGRQAQLPSWDVCGFELLAHGSAVADWQDEAAIASQHYKEMAQLAQRLTGCDHALVSGHIKRNPQQAAVHADYGPIAFVHSDFAASYGAAVREMYQIEREGTLAALQRAGIDKQVVRGARRLLILQFWRNLGPALMDQPLAFCDARSVPHEDVCAQPVVNYAGGGFDFETIAVMLPTGGREHKWYVFPEMGIDEVVAFRTYDSALVTSGGAYWTPHSAFCDPRVELGTPSRSSIEIRVTCLFD